MSEEIQEGLENVVEEGEEQSEQQDAPKASKYEADARTMGWRPESEFSGDPEDFVSAKEFVQRKAFFDKISDVKKENKELRESIAKFAEHHKNIETYTRKQILAELKSQKKEALATGDEDRLVEVDDAIVQFHLKEKEFEAEEKVKEAQAKAKNNGDAPEFVEWKSRNKWYTTDPELTEDANDLGSVYHNRNPDKSPMDVLAHVEKQIRKLHPEKFANANREKATTVETGGKGDQGSRHSKDVYKLSDDEKKIGQKWVKQGLYKDLNEYATELKKLNGE
jgi:hypothetical protein